MARIDAYRANPIAAPATTPLRGPQKSGAAEKTGFSDMLVDSMKEAAHAETQAETAAADMVSGKADIHEAIIAQEKAGIALRFAVTLKNKAVEAYREIMNTQI